MLKYRDDAHPDYPVITSNVFLFFLDVSCGWLSIIACGFAPRRDTGHNFPVTCTAYIAMGSNLGDRRAYLASAADAIGALPGVEVVTLSPIYETDPVGGPAEQGKFLNCAAAVKTTLTPEALLHALHRIEADLGRDRAGESTRNGPRTLDLDIVLFGDLVIDEHHLTIPHPRMHQRPFVLQPLCDLAPDAIHPVMKKTVSELLEATE